MTTALKHKQRSRKTNGPIFFKSKDMAKHELMYGSLIPIYKDSKNHKRY